MTAISNRTKSMPETHTGCVDLARGHKSSQSKGRVDRGTGRVWENQQDPHSSVQLHRNRFTIFRGSVKWETSAERKQR